MKYPYKRVRSQGPKYPTRTCPHKIPFEDAIKTFPFQHNCVRQLLLRKTDKRELVLSLSVNILTSLWLIIYQVNNIQYFRYLLDT